ncbi:MAG: acetate--CoA ligase family protein, partial [Alphaproteobacteria bacterium]|nr:acetate--CoA ligase family protein [Alphaproteobacteria bacterium]
LAGSLTEHPGALIALSIIAPPEVVADYEDAGFVVFEDPSRAVAALAALSDFGAAFARDGIAAAVPAADTTLSGAMTEHAAKAVLAGAGLPVLPEVLAGDSAGAVAAAEAMGYPVVLKIVSAQITHKTEIGGVALNLRDADAVAAAAEGILSRAAAAHPDAVIDGLLVAPMAPAGVEMILGIQRDPVFGPVVMCGLGGIFAEVMRDVTFRAAPIDVAEAERMIGELKGQAVLDGVRGRPGGDRTALAQALVDLSRFAAAHAADLETCDINPFVLHERGGVALDAVIVGAG